MLVTGWVAGCAGADQPGEAVPENEATGAGSDVAPAVDSACADGVTVEWQGSPTTDDVYTAVRVVRLAADGGTSVTHEWDRGEEAAAKTGSDVSGEKRAMVDDAVAGGLISVDAAPELPDPGEELSGNDKGKYIQFAYARHSSQTATVSCAGVGESVDATVVGFETLQTGSADCASSPDPVTEFAAADAISSWCELG